MAKECTICNKGKQMGNTRKLLRGHYNITGRRTVRPNLQKTLHQGSHIVVCTSCLRTLHKETQEKNAVATA